MPEVRVIKSFFDVSGKTVRHVSTEYECDEARARKLASYGFVEVIGIPAEEPSEEPQAVADEPKPKRSRKKKAQ